MMAPLRFGPLLALAAFVLPFVSSVPVNEPRAIPPPLDPFYNPPAGFENEAPGTILRERRIIPAIFGLIPNPVEAYQLLYRTTAIDGSAIATVTTIFKPSDPKLDRFVSFQTAYDSSAPICSPSYNYQLASVQVSLIASVELLIIEAYLLKGYIVASHDYEGPEAAFSPGRLAGPGVLDGIRAVSHYNTELGLTTDKPKVVGVGYSGGAIATGWAAALQPTYAPELDIKGWVSGGTPANLTGTLVYIDDTVFSGFLPASIAGLTKPTAYGAELQPVIDQIITPYGQSQLDFANANCGPADLLAFAHQSILSTDFQSLGPGLLTEPTIAGVLQQNILGIYRNETPTAPVFLYHATPDEVIPYANASTLAQSWCEYGVSVNFTTFAAGGHLTTEVLGVPYALDFTAAAFDGVVPAGCSSATVLDNALDPLALGANLEPVTVQLINALLDAGPQDANILSNLSVLTG